MKMTLAFTSSSAPSQKKITKPSVKKVKPSQIGNNFMSLAYLTSVAKNGCKSCGH